jgi:hypothetical protein
MAGMHDGEMETMVLVPYTAKVFKRRQNNGPLIVPRIYVRRWLKEMIGPQCEGINNCSDATPWRHRLFNGKNHAFFFRTRDQAMLFKLAFGGI